MFRVAQRFRIFQIHKVDREVDRLTEVMRIGNRDIERIADDVDGPRCDGKIDRDVAAIDDQRLVGFDTLAEIRIPARFRQCVPIVVLTFSYKL